MLQISLSCPCHPTEPPEKVVQAITNIFPDASLEIEETEILGNSSDLATFKKMIREQKIRDTARQVLAHSVSGNTMAFHLNKQAAFVSKVNFTESKIVLGTITVKISGDDIQSMIEELAPKKMAEDGGVEKEDGKSRSRNARGGDEQ